MMASPTLSTDSLLESNSSNFHVDQETTSASSSSISVTDSPTASLNSCSSTGSVGYLNTRCELCNNTFVNPKVLPCLHTFCQECIDHNKNDSDQFMCPQCQEDCNLTAKNDTLMPNFLIKNILSAFDDSKVYCTGCKNKTSFAVARCFDCFNYLCSNCVTAHQSMHCFEGHRIMKLNPEYVKSEDGISFPKEKIMSCLRHKTETLLYFCRTCNVSICKECTESDHPASLHDWDYCSAGSQAVETYDQSIQELRAKAADLRNCLKKYEDSFTHLRAKFEKAQHEIHDTFNFYKSLLEERKKELLKELEGLFSEKQLSLTLFLQKANETTDKIYNACDYCEKFKKQSRFAEYSMLKTLIDSSLQQLTKSNIDNSIQSIYDLEFVSNFQAIQVGIKNTYGYVRSSPDIQLEPNKQPPIARPNISISSMKSPNYDSTLPTLNGLAESLHSNETMNPCTAIEKNFVSTPFTANNSFGPFPTSMRSASSMNINPISSYEKWSNGPDIYKNYSLPLAAQEEPVVDLSSKLFSTSLTSIKPQVKRQKMIYHCKFGEFGFLEGQFTEPSGVAVNAQNDLIVADTNNHRVQIFDNEGRFKFQFGECGKRDGQFLYPNRVAVVKTSGDIIVTERSPTHQVQIYNQYGQFVRKFGASILQYPRGVTVDYKGRIIVIECKVMRVIIFDQNGSVLKKFGCSKHVEFPNGVVVNDKEEIFISDNRAHCVKVFNYEGTFLRQIGCYGLINYPIGVGINSNGDILIADNHNNFNLTIFTQEGQFISALESKIKHAQCFDIALMDDGSVVLASKDYRLYVYRYVPIPPVVLE